MKEMVPSRVKIEMSGLNRRYYFTSFPISNCKLISFNAPLRETDEKDLRLLGDKGEKFVRKAFCLPGTTDLVISSYQLTIGKSQAVLWKEIEPGLFQLFKEVFELEEVKVFGPGEEFSPGCRGLIERLFGALGEFAPR